MVHKALGIINIPPLERADGTRWTKPKVIKEFGFPVLSKEIAAKIELLQNPSEKNKTVRHAIITGETGEYGGWQKNSRMRMSQKWLEKFGGFGIHMEKRPHRFDMLYQSNPKEWDYLMFHLCKDENGNDYGWAKVLDYIGVGWRPEDLETEIPGQMNITDFPEVMS